MFIENTNNKNTTDNISSTEPEEKTKKILEENLELTKEIYQMTKKIRKFVIWQQVFGVIKILLIVAPIVLGIIYLPSLLKNVLEPYKELLNITKDGQEIDISNLNLNALPPDILKMLKK